MRQDQGFPAAEAMIDTTLTKQNDLEKPKQESRWRCCEWGVAVVLNMASSPCLYATLPSLHTIGATYYLTVCKSVREGKCPSSTMP
jgi:hypothetical protein